MVAILTSGISLGHYTPALLLARQLELRGVPAETFLHEDLLTERSRGGIAKARRAYHRSARFAAAAQKMGSGIAADVDPACLLRLFDGWRRAGVRRFVVLSGYWVPLLDSYARDHAGGEVEVDLLHVDSVESPSWQAAADYRVGRHTWLFSWSERRVVQTLPTGAAVVPFGERERRLVVHGGGLGIGGYREFLSEGLDRGFACDVRRYFDDDELPAHARIREFAQPADWEPWVRDPGGRHAFPPLCLGAGEGCDPIVPRAGHHPALELIRGAMAVVSKPGGATLLDSLETATPVVFLPPYGEHEGKNLELWTALDFGITLEAWRASGFSTAVLERLHASLLRARQGAPSYPEAYVRRMSGAGGG